MARFALKFLNGLYEFVLGTIIMVAVAFASYSIWDNAQVYRAAEYVQEQIRQLKPAEEADDGSGFEALRAINEDVIAWLTVDDTNIDYPVLQGDTNLTYMNRDVYGDFSLAGSIFLDIRNKPDFSDNYSLIYGHNMENHLMFGDLALFKDKNYFLSHTDASLILPDQTSEMKVAAILQISAGTEELFNPDMWEKNLEGFGEFLQNNSIWYHSDLIQQLISKPGTFQIVALATCSDGSTNDRTVLILVKDKPVTDTDTETEEKPTNPETVPNTPTTDRNDTVTGNGPKPTGDAQDRRVWILLILGAVMFIAVFETAERFAKKLDE